MPVLAHLDGLPESLWTDVGLFWEAVLVHHSLLGWGKQANVLVRKQLEDGQGRLLPVRSAEGTPIHSPKVR